MPLPLLEHGLEVEAKYACAWMELSRLPQNLPMHSVEQIAVSEPKNRVADPIEYSFEGLLDVAPDAIVVADQDGRIICVNAQTESLFQYPRTELLGKQIEILMPERFRERHYQHRDAYFNDPKPRPMGVGQEHLYGLKSDGQEFPLEISLGVLPTDNGHLAVSVIRDVTEKKRLELHLLERTQQLEKSNRNKDEFLGMLAHELRSPLAAVCMAAEVLRQRPVEDDSEQLWDIIKRQSEQMLHLIEDLMDVSRIAHAKVRIQKVQVDLDRLIRQAIEAVQPLLSIRKHQLTFSLPVWPIELFADPVRLVEVFTNLLNNAAKYTNEGGQIFLQASADGDEVVIEFRDNGIGISAEMLPRIFEPFTQVPGAMNHAEGGIGIGLAMVAHLVRLHAGTVHAFSDGPGQGSQFIVRLPSLKSINMKQSYLDAVEHRPHESNGKCPLNIMH